MTPPDRTSEPPRKLLLATDLGPRSDRALDRAAALAAYWQAELVILHALEISDAGMPDQGEVSSWRRPPDPVRVAWKHLEADLSAIGKRATVIIGEGDPATAILRTAEAEHCDLIVVGVARDELLGRLRVGRTTDRLLRRARSPLLVVKARPRRPYRHIVVATDFSPSSRHALETAARVFPEQRLTLFHASDAPAPGPMTSPGAHHRELREAAVRACHAFLETVEKPATWQTPHLLIEDGSPTFLLRDYVQEKDVDLVVLGTHGRSAMLEVFTGSVAKGIVREVPCDALVVREPHAAVEQEPAGSP
jgi:nucleotide-binding universal stress UspA family protein